MSSTSNASSTVAIELSHYVEQARKGDKAAFQTLVSKMTGTVGAIALGITKDLHDSKDVSQLVFIKMWQQLSQLKNNDSILPWIRQITRYTAFNFIRDRKSDREQSRDDEAMEVLLERVCDEQHHNDSVLIKQQQNELVAHLLDQLPDESREIVILYYREEHDSNAVANLLGIKESTVRKRLQRVRRVLKENILAKYGKVIFATAPVGLATTFALTAMTSAPVAASTIAYSAAASSNSHWLYKLFAGLGGAAIGGIVAVISNNLMMKFVLKHIDNDNDVNQLTKLKHQSNAWMVISCLLLSLSYHFTQGWGLPVISYLLFLIGLANFVNAINKISFANLTRQATVSEEAANKLVLSKWGCVFGWIAGLGGGTFGLLFGLYINGRFSQLF
jgi:RNA polymerase sigma factor (sigma-70 family)